MVYTVQSVSEIKRNSDPRQLVGDVVDIEDMVRYGEKQRYDITVF